MPHIDYYFATLSPYTYLAGTRFETVAAKHGASVTYKPVDIIALFGRTGGTLPADRHPARVEYRAQELVRLARKLDMPFNLKPAHWPTNGAPAAYAFIAAQNAGKQLDQSLALDLIALMPPTAIASDFHLNVGGPVRIPEMHRR